MDRLQSSPSRRSSPEIPPLMNCEEWRVLSHRLGLPGRQAAVVELVLQGKRDKQIATCLELSHATVRTHLREIYRRFKVTDRVELVLRIAAIREQKAPDLI